MIADTNYLIDLYHERRARRVGPATVFRNAHRSETIRITVISIAEFSAGFKNHREARVFLDLFRTFRFFPEAAYEAGAIDREMMQKGERLGEADTFIAGLARYYGETLISNDAAFRRVPGLRVLTY